MVEGEARQIAQGFGSVTRSGDECLVVSVRDGEKWYAVLVYREGLVRTETTHHGEMALSEDLEALLGW